MIDFFRGKVTRRDWMAVGGILAATVGLILVYVFVINKGQLERLAQAETIRQDAANALAHAKRIEATYQDLLEEVEMSQRVVETFETRLPTSRELRELVGKIEDMAEESELSIEVEPNIAIPGQFKNTFPYTVTAYGNFHEIVTFINAIERYERYLKVSDLQIEEEEDGVSTATFTLSTYVFNEDAAGA